MDKTTLAGIIASSLGRRFVPLSGPLFRDPMDLIGTLYCLDHGTVLFIDEIHALPRKALEFLYTAMEDFYLDAVSGQGADAVPVRVPVQPFTLVGATTRKGLLPQPLIERFGLDVPLALYAQGDLARIVSRSARLLGLRLGPSAAETIASAARGTPRIANRLVRRVRDHVLVHAAGRACTAELAREALRHEGIDAAGLDALDRTYLRTLVGTYGGTAGVAALAATMQTDAATLETAVEPWLLHAGYIIRTPRGRQATDLARTHLRHTSEAGVRPPFDPEHAR